MGALAQVLGLDIVLAGVGIVIIGGAALVGARFARQFAPLRCRQPIHPEINPMGRAITGRTLARDEIDLIWTLDRSEIIDAVYFLEDGALVLRPEHYNMTGWLPGTERASTPHLLDCLEHGGWFYGLFPGGKLAGVAVLENRFIGRPPDMLQLVFLHVDSAFRDEGLGTALFRAAAEEGRRRGARRLYVSATPSEHTIHFYLGLGCMVTPRPDPELLALEPDDIHLEYSLTA